LGEVTKGFIKKIRTDTKIDLALVKQGYDRIDNVKSIIYALLISKNGFLPYTDKTDSDVIYRDLQMSKKDFKKAVGGLYRDHKVKIEDDGIYTSTN
jgi:predicted RNA-binding protein (virulence factor B family)